MSAGKTRCCNAGLRRDDEGLKCANCLQPIISVEPKPMSEEKSRCCNVKMFIDDNGFTCSSCWSIFTRDERPQEPPKLKPPTDEQLIKTAIDCPHAQCSMQKIDARAALDRVMKLSRFVNNPIKLADLEHFAITAALRRNDFSITAASRSLGIGRTTLYRKLQQYGITRKLEATTDYNLKDYR